jgi:mannosylglycerate hydrolase
MSSVTGLRFFVVPHTHWDREWYLPLEHFRLELAAVVDDVLATLERDPAFRSFTLDGQAVVLEDYLELRPEQEGRLRALLADGRLSVGPSYVLPDELLVGGESLVRNLLLGRAVCERLGARPSRAGYMPDSFGHPAQLPQVLRGFGVESFLFSRGLGDELERLGRVFRWRAPDGSEVAAFNLLGHYDSVAALRSPEDLAERVERLVERHRDELARVGLRDVLLCNGSDHLPVQPELPELLRRCEKLLPGARFELASFDDYVAAALPTPRRLPVYEGELLGSREHNVLRGVNSARIYLKQANERAERRLLAAQTAAALAALAGRLEYPAADFRFAWRELLRNHPHDSICGCSVDEVHEDMMERYTRLERTISVLERKAVAALAGGALPLDAREAGELYRPGPRAAQTVLNPLPWRRRRLLELELPPELSRARGLVGEVGGEELPVEKAGRRALVAVELDGLAAATLTLRKGDPGTPRRRRRAIANELYRVEAARDGSLTVTDLRTGERHRGLHRLEDERDLGDLYTFCPDPKAAPWRSDARDVEVRSRILSAGPFVSELELALRGPHRIRTRVRLVAGIDRIEFETELDNRARDHRLRAVFPAPDAGDTVRAEGQFAVVHRPVAPPPPRVDWAEPPDPTQHTLGAVALGDLALFTKGLPEYEARGRELALTLLRCVGMLSRGRGELSTRPGAAGPRTPTPGGQCQGRHRFSYALRFGATALDHAELLRAAHDYRCDFLLGPVGAPPPPPVVLAGDPIAFSCLKGAEDGDGVVLRLYNPSGRRARVRIEGPDDVSRLRLDETQERSLARRTIVLRAGEIATLRLRA